MSRVIDFEAMGSKRDPINTDTALCSLPLGSGAVFVAVLNDVLEGTLYRNALRLLRHEIARGDSQIGPMASAQLRAFAMRQRLDSTREEVLLDIVGYLSGRQEDKIRLAEMLEGEDIVTGDFVESIRKENATPPRMVG